MVDLGERQPTGVVGVGVGAEGIDVVAGTVLIGDSSHICPVEAPVDMRRGVDGLPTAIQEKPGQAPCSGKVFVFRNKTGNRLRLLFWDGNGVWLCQRRLHRGSFVWPKVTDPGLNISQAQGDRLMAGVDRQRLSRLLDPDWRI